MTALNLPESLNRDYSDVYGDFRQMKSVGKSKKIKAISAEALIKGWQKSLKNKGWKRTNYPTVELWTATTSDTQTKVNVVIIDLDKDGNILHQIAPEGYGVIY